MLSGLRKQNKTLTMREINFITTIATDFIDSYSFKGQVKTEQEEDEELAAEINICRNLIEKFGLKD